MKARSTLLKYFSISSLLLLCLCMSPAYSQPFFKLDSGMKRTSMPFNFTRNMVIIRLKINNKGPYNFILDTGVGLMIITDPTLVDSLNLKNKRLITVAGMGEGKDFQAYVVPSIKVTMPGIIGESISAAVLKDDNFGLSNYAGIKIHGLLGYEFFDSFAVKLSFSDSTLTAGLAKDIRIFRHSEKIPLTIESHKPYMITKVQVNAKSPKIEDKLIVDLGAGHPLSLEDPISENHSMPEKYLASNLGISLTGPINGFLSRINEIEIGKYKLKQVIASFPNYDASRTGLITVKRNGNIGIGILKKFNLIIDYQNSVMYVKPNVFYSEPFEHDMSGLEYYATGDELDRIVINRVEKGSAGDEIGLKKGDEIIKINFRAVKNMTIQEIDNLFRSRPERSIILEIEHGNQQNIVILRLKRRI